MFKIIDKGPKFKKGRYYWHVTAKNGKILCHSETYNSHAGVAKGALAAFEQIAQYIVSHLKG